MSDQLREALRVMKNTAAKDQANECPVTFLHDPDGGKPFAALVSLPLVDELETTGSWDPMNHSHREGDEDEPAGSSHV